MTEDRLQYECVTSFHKNHKESRGALFEVNNKTNKGAYRKGLGTVPGASDLAFCTISGRLIGLELKVQGSRHEIDHLSRQLAWGDMIAARGGEYFFIFSVEQFKKVIRKIVYFGTDEQVRDMAGKTRDYVRGVIEDGKKRGVKSVKLEYEG